MYFYFGARVSHTLLTLALTPAQPAHTETTQKVHISTKIKSFPARKSVIKHKHSVRTPFFL